MTTTYVSSFYKLSIISFIVALLLEILPMPGAAVWFRPEWAVLVTLYWVMVCPQRVNVGIAWIIGLLLDALTGSVLGEHAFALTILAFLMSQWQRQFKNFPMWQSLLLIGGFVFLYKVIICIVQGVIGQPINTFRYFLSIPTTMLFWPWVQAVLAGRHSRLSYGAS